MAPSCDGDSGAGRRCARAGVRGLFVELANRVAAGHGQEPAGAVELQLGEALVLRLRRRPG